MISASHQDREDTHRHTPPKYLQCKQESFIADLKALAQAWDGPGAHDDATRLVAGLRAVLAKHGY